MTTKYIDTTVEVGLEEWTTEELQKELIDRKKDLAIGTDGIEHLIRHGIEDRDWSKIEEFAEKLDIHFFRRKS